MDICRNRHRLIQIRVEEHEMNRYGLAGLVAAFSGVEHWCDSRSTREGLY